MEWQDYEEITKHIYATLGEAHGVKIEGHGKDCKVIGKSGVEHQIDVLTSHSDGIHSYRTMIECKYWDQNVNKDVIMKVAEIVEDAGLNKGIIVSKNGFTPDAINYARYRNIGLVELRKPTDEDWRGRLRNIVVEMNMVLPTLTECLFLITPETPPFPWMNSKLGMNAELLSIRNPDTPVKSIEECYSEFYNELSKKKEGEAYEQFFSFPKGTVVVYTPTEETMPIQGIKFGGILKIAKQSFEIKGDDYIHMIMNSIFEGKSYSITKDLKIKERKNIKSET
ncbi:MAG: restriction endonuclease [Phocaeicola vulgatus]|jgi:hypothetical protein|uniref:Restriction endonuclease n=1 Tax=Phocaeicola vulgatus TaxID=821 RepID=A0A1Q6ILV9_PHOVU|nr:MAG: restriction endonuclease [Phocaeicola vulgatus]